jgi:3-isopropylmalate dehydrogenase
VQRILVLPGDGIGPEIVNEALKVLDRVAELEGMDIEVDEA